MRIYKKIAKNYFNDICKGIKTFELRQEDDCIYSVGDYIILQEYVNNQYTKREIIVRIIYKLSSKEFPQALKENWVILGINKESEVL